MDGDVDEDMDTATKDTTIREVGIGKYCSSHILYCYSNLNIYRVII